MYKYTLFSSYYYIIKEWPLGINDIIYLFALRLCNKIEDL